MPAIFGLDWIGLGKDFQATLWIGLDWIHDLMDSIAGLDWVRKNGPMSNSAASRIGYNA